jgi:hypothetical protein
VEELAFVLVGALVGVGTEEVALGLEEVGGKLGKRLASFSVIKTQERLQLLIWMTKDHVEGQEVAVLQVAVSRQGVDGERLEGVFEEQAVLA